MNKLLVNIICAFIVKKKNRHHFRDKYYKHNTCYIKNTYKLFNIIPLLKIKKRNDKTSYLLFSFFPLLKIIVKDHKKSIFLFGFIIFIKIKDNIKRIEEQKRVEEKRIEEQNNEELKNKINDKIQQNNDKIDNLKNLILFQFFIDNLQVIDTAKFTKTINPNTPHIPIFLSSDDNYAPFLATTTASICYNTNSFIDIYVLDGGIEPSNKAKILELEKQFNNLKFEFTKIDTKKEFKNFQLTEHTLNAYNRLLIPEITKLDKVIYLDVDLIVLTDIAELYNVNLDNNIIGAAFEIIRNGCDDYKINEFNTGVMLIDCEKWRKNNITKECFEVAKKYKGKLPFADQSILNKVFEKENRKELEKKWNVTNYIYWNNFDKKHDIINIRHWAGGYKPWNSLLTSSSDFANLFWFYAKMTPFFKKTEEIFINKNK